MYRLGFLEIRLWEKKEQELKVEMGPGELKFFKYKMRDMVMFTPVT